MSFTFFITKRFISSKKEKGVFSFFSLFTLLGISIGVATLIIAISILRGFEQIITQKLVDLDSHIQVIGFGDKPLSNYQNTNKQIEKIIYPYESKIQLFVSRLAIVSHKGIKEGINIKGVEKDYFLHIKNIIPVSGSFNLSQSTDENQIIIGKTLANKLLVNVGDDITVFALRNNEIPSIDNPPNIEKFKVTGIFESGMSKYDDAYAYTDLETAQKLFSLNNLISGFEIKLNNISKIDSLEAVLQSNLRYPHYVKTVFETYRPIFTWIELQKKPIPIILGLIIIVAVVNIISTMLIIVLEKMNTIGTLKAIGASRRQINRIFLSQGIYLGIGGVLLGNVIAYTLTKLQLTFNIITLPSSVYFTSKVPLVLEASTFAMVSCITLILCIATSYLPSYISSKINPVSTIRFN
jgi:lipoprotein-releasing system permease protein